MTDYNIKRTKSKAEQDMLEQEEREYHELCHAKVMYQSSGLAAEHARNGEFGKRKQAIMDLLKTKVLA